MLQRRTWLALCAIIWYIFHCFKSVSYNIRRKMIFKSSRGKFRSRKSEVSPTTRDGFMNDWSEVLSVSPTFSHSPFILPSLFTPSSPGSTYPFVMAYDSQEATLVPKSVFPKLSFSVTVWKCFGRGWSCYSHLWLRRLHSFIYCAVPAF